MQRPSRATPCSPPTPLSRPCSSPSPPPSTPWASPTHPSCGSLTLFMELKPRVSLLIIVCLSGGGGTAGPRNPGALKFSVSRPVPSLGAGDLGKREAGTRASPDLVFPGARLPRTLSPAGPEVSPFCSPSAFQPRPALSPYLSRSPRRGGKASSCQHCLMRALRVLREGPFTDESPQGEEDPVLILRSLSGPGTRGGPPPGRRQPEGGQGCPQCHRLATGRAPAVRQQASPLSPCPGGDRSAQGPNLLAGAVG